METIYFIWRLSTPPLLSPALLHLTQLTFSISSLSRNIYVLLLHHFPSTCTAAVSVKRESDLTLASVIITVFPLSMGAKYFWVLLNDRERELLTCALMNRVEMYSHVPERKRERVIRICSSVHCAINCTVSIWPSVEEEVEEGSKQFAWKMNFLHCYYLRDLLPRERSVAHERCYSYRANHKLIQWVKKSSKNCTVNSLKRND